MMKKSIKKTLITTKLRTSILALVCVFTTLFCSIPVQAAEAKTSSSAKISSYSNIGNTVANSTTSNIITPLAGSGYAASYTDSYAGSFTITPSGGYSAIGSVSIKTWDFGSSSVYIYVSIYRPDGSRAVADYKLVGNTYAQDITFVNAPAGTYTVRYSIGGNPRGWIGVWFNQ